MPTAPAPTMRKVEIASMDEDEVYYHLRFRPRAISGRRLHPNGGHRRPRPIGGVYTTRYCHVNPTSEPIGRSVAFLEQQSLPDPIITGNVIWDASNVNLKNLFESVVGKRKYIHSKSSTTPKLKGNSSKVAKMWKVCDDTLSVAREISVFLRQQGFLPYPEPLWFSSRETGMHTFHDITIWNECVHGLLAAKVNGCGALGALAGMAKDGGCTFLGSKLAIEEDGELPDGAKESGMLAEEGGPFSENAKESSKFPVEKAGVFSEKAKETGMLAEEGVVFSEKESSKFPAEKGAAIAEYKEWSKLREEEERALAEKARWSNWPTSFINWNYEKKFEKEMAEAEAREQANKEANKDLDEGEGKARWSLGA